MDNHQAELAEALEKEGHLTVSTVECDTMICLSGHRLNNRQLDEILEAWVKRGPMKPFPGVKGDRFRSIMDEMMGFDP